jgi:predicted DNA-binding transcriptional regulator AlpA
MPAKHVSVKEFSATRGLSASSIWRYIRAGKLPFSQPGGRGHRVTIPEDAILAHTVKAATVSTAEVPSTTPFPASKHLSGPTPAWMRVVSI